MIKKYKIYQFYILIFMPNWGTIYIRPDMLMGEMMKIMQF